MRASNASSNHVLHSHYCQTLLYPLLHPYTTSYSFQSPENKKPPSNAQLKPQSDRLIRTFLPPCQPLTRPKTQPQPKNGLHRIYRYIYYHRITSHPVIQQQIKHTPNHSTPISPKIALPHIHIHPPTPLCRSTKKRITNMNESEQSFTSLHRHPPPFQ